MEEKDYYEEDKAMLTSRLKDGVLLKELINDMATEFTLDASKGEDIEDTNEMERRVETCYEYQDFAPFINLDCVQIDPSDSSVDASPFEILAAKMTDVTDDEGVKKLIKREGTGPVVPKNAVVYVHYNSYLEMEEVPFDTSYLRSAKPNRFQLGTGSLYAGFELAIASMKKGEKSQFLVQPNYAFGKMGAPPRIPPNASLLLEIELLNFVDCGSIVDVKHLPNEDKKKFPAAYKAALSYHALGNDYFSKPNIPAAVENYKKAENLLTGCIMSNNEEENKQKKLLMKIYVNLCICYNDQKMKSPEKVCIMAREACMTSPKDAKSNPKLHYNWGKALMALNDFTKAASHFKCALKLQPNNTDISAQLKILEEKKKKYFDHEKISYQKFFGFNSKPEPPKKEEETVKQDAKESHSSEFENVIREELKAFIDGNQSRIQLPHGLTEEEKKLCRSVAAELNLNYSEQLVSNTCEITITK